MTAIHPHLLVIDDDPVFNRVLSRALTQRGFSVYSAHSQAEALQLADAHEPEFVVLDLNLDGESGLKLVTPLLGINPNARILVLTGYASIATAVNAVKLGQSSTWPSRPTWRPSFMPCRPTNWCWKTRSTAVRCRWTRSSGSTSSVCSPSMAATFPPPHGR